uniref:Uncharacterized protein n=1 Tax=Arundo donax TaxID=35708 RepID=A0A0A9EKR4_ARUDO
MPCMFFVSIRRKTILYCRPVHYRVLGLTLRTM